MIEIFVVRHQIKNGIPSHESFERILRVLNAKLLGGYRLWQN